MISVYPCGTKVKINDTSITGYVSAITMRWNNIAYEVTWWTEDVKKMEWCTEVDFTVLTEDTKKEPIGFNTNEHSSKQ